MANPLLQQYIKVTEFLGLTLGPDYEVALHDMTDKTVPSSPSPTTTSAGAMSVRR